MRPESTGLLGALPIIAIAAICFAMWPVAMKMSGLKPGLSSVLLSITTAMVVAVPFFGQYAQETQGMIFKGILFGIAAGVINGFGTFYYNKLISGPIEVSKLLICVIAIQITVCMIGARIFNNEPITVKKVFGAAVAIVAVRLMV